MYRSYTPIGSKIRCKKSRVAKVVFVKYRTWYMEVQYWNSETGPNENSVRVCVCVFARIYIYPDGEFLRLRHAAP